MGILETLTAAEYAAEQAAADAYHGLVLELGDGADLELPDVQRILAAVNKTATQLERDVSDYQNEKSLRDTVAERDAALTEREEINRKIEESGAKVTAATEAHQRFCYPLDVRLDEIMQLIHRGADADQQLVRRGDKNWITE